jgi:predicted phage terminase large subunit-like protein
MLTREERLDKLYTKKELTRRRVRKSFYAFVKEAWPHIWPTPFIDNWHFRYVCEQIQTVVERVLNNEKRQQDLCINVPPGTAKSTVVSICLNAWVWTKDPTRRFLTTSYSPALAGDHAKATRKLLESEWYKDLFPKVKLVSSAETFFETGDGGRRMITSPGSSIGTGFHADFLIFDDPDSATNIYSEAYRKSTIEWFDGTMPSRLSNPECGLKIIVQQRLHQQDITGHVRKNYPEKYQFIILPATASNIIYPTELEKFYVNGLLFPGRLTVEVLEDYKKRLRHGYSGQFDMSPQDREGNFYKAHWVNYFQPAQLPRLDQIIISVDASFTESAESCPTSIQAWGLKKPNFYMLFDLTARMGAVETVTAIERVYKSYPGAILVIEKAANGYYVIEQLRKKLPGVYEFVPKKYGGKEVRADMVAPLWETGNVYIGDTPYNRNTYMPEILAFPNATFKDRVDAMSQALIYFTRCYTSAGYADVNVH